MLLFTTFLHNRSWLFRARDSLSDPCMRFTYTRGRSRMFYSLSYPRQYDSNHANQHQQAGSQTSLLCTSHRPAHDQYAWGHASIRTPTSSFSTPCCARDAQSTSRSRPYPGRASGFSTKRRVPWAFSPSICQRATLSTTTASTPSAEVLTSLIFKRCGPAKSQRCKCDVNLVLGPFNVCCHRCSGTMVSQARHDLVLFGRFANGVFA